MSTNKDGQHKTEPKAPYEWDYAAEVRSELGKEEAGSDTAYRPDGARQGEETTKPHQLNNPSAFDYAPHKQPDNKNRRNRGGMSGIMKSGRNRMAMGIAAGLISIALSIAAFFALLPLKLIGITDEVQDRFTGFANSAIQERTDTLFEQYAKRYILTSLGPNCRTTRDRNCVYSGPFSQTTPAGRLWRGWSDARLENKLAERYGIEFKYSGNTTRATYTFAIDGTDIFSNVGADEFDGKFRETLRGRSEVRHAFRESIQGETRLKQAWLRHKGGKLLERKYGVKRCIFACEVRDNFADRNAARRDAFKAKVVERVITPRSESLGLMADCLIDPDACLEAGERGPHGEKRSKMEERVDKKVTELSAKYGTQSVDALLAESRLIAEKGLSKYILEKAFGQTIAKFASKGIPVIGWIDLAVNIVHGLIHAPRALAVAKYSTYAASSASMYMMYVTAANECKAGECDLDKVGSLIDSLETKGADGNGASAEGSPLYDSLMGPGGTTLGASFTPAVHAQSEEIIREKSPVATCDDGSGKAICKEDSFSLLNGEEVIIDDNLSWITSITGAWKDTISRALEWAGNLIVRALKLIPGVGAGINWAEARFAELQQWVSETVFGYLFPNPFGPESDGDTNFKGMVAGAAASGAEMGNNGIGGVGLNPQQASAILKDQYDQRRYAFEKKNLFARLFDTKDTNSGITRFAMMMPSNKAGVTDSAFAYMSQPLSPALTLAASKVTPPAYAAETSYIDRTVAVHSGLHVEMIGVPKGDPVFEADPDLFTDENCEIINEAWQEGTNAEGTPYDFTGTLITNQATGYNYHTAVNPCMLEKQATGAAGALFTNEVLEPDERNLAGGPGGGPVTSIAGLECPANLGGPDPANAGYYQLPEAPNGEYTMYSTPRQRYGSKELICVIYTVAKAYNGLYPNSRLSVGDLNATGHASHSNGIDVDLDAQGDPIAGDMLLAGYSQEASIALGKLFLDTNKVRKIYFNDEQVRNAVNAYAVSKGKSDTFMQYWSGHENHFHVRIDMPEGPYHKPGP